MSEHSGNELPLSRRDALAAMAVGAGVALSACTPGGDETGGAGAEGADGGATHDSQGPRAWVKDSSPFVQHGTNLETRLADLDGLLTPNDLFFVRNHAPTPTVDPGSYRLAVGGPGAETQIELSLDELRALPSHTLISYIECAGNWRGFFQRITGRDRVGQPVGHRVRWGARSGAGRGSATCSGWRASGATRSR